MTIHRQTYEALDAVRMFNELNGQLINLTPPKEAIPSVVAALRARLILEELGEVAVALHEHDRVQIADGLADLLYVVLGAGVSYGLPLADFWEDQRITSDDHDSALEIKSMHLLADSAAGAVAAIRGASYACGCDDPTCESRVVTTTDLEKLAEHLDTLKVAVVMVALKHRIPLKEVFFEVHRSNLTKKLGGAKGGAKYGEGGGKGAGYQPPDIAKILSERSPGPAAADPR